MSPQVTPGPNLDFKPFELVAHTRKADFLDRQQRVVVKNVPVNQQFLAALASIQHLLYPKIAPEPRTQLLSFN